VTTRPRVGNWVLANDLRNPVLLAREAGTLAALSDDRFDLGLGAGRADNDAAGIGLEPVSGATRVRRLDETLRIIRRLVHGARVTCDGQHYRVSEASAYPTPLVMGSSEGIVEQFQALAPIVERLAGT
jgi:alkanesulfonate monooxygenase SsuD/methylene tetrahydromethanopterin reductase-like flavin-dependent oxidoreductase (luciferase family)